MTENLTDPKTDHDAAQSAEHTGPPLTRRGLLAAASGAAAAGAAGCTAGDGFLGGGGSSDGLGDVLVLEDGDLHVIQSGTTESYTAIDWFDGGAFVLEDGATLEVLA